ncbi:hypothetical protein TTHERM_00590090 (macronuclear) [Tetrahymena thermophila SB210]|uniref:Uncharacterized protein n=2 Tax=Tetrahymena thermophila TaxID=5911 RepID=I7MKP4_TETTS|nr:hypothetical protein TTHERM_00590090 [Tetrahymena thermophila SB210]EAR99672.1 hypothetical protein TTHERM_00590090 [Tetrahymena thermophila SB210]BAA83425.1 p85 [Tetrahymena thermophila]|eukprot:XP_001019917.1 hypothetical protein TTHERM_00590090 [Tetrahymena thermophila SB210]
MRSSTLSILLLCILGASIAQNLNDANQDILQQVINGFYEQNKLADPSTIVPCIDSTTAANIVALVPQVLKKASSILTIAQVPALVENFVKTLNPAVGECLKDNKEVAELATVFDVSKITQQAAINWATGHASTVTGEASTLNKLWSGAQYNQFGNNASSFAHTVIDQISGKSVSESNDANQDIIQQVINGFYEQNKLADPTTIVPCIDTTTAANIVALVPQVLKKASSILTIAQVATLVENFVKTLNPAVGECLKDNKEVAELATVFDVSKITQQAAINWATGHASTVTGEATTLNKLWSSAQYNQLGNNASSFAHTVINQISGNSVSESNDANQDIIQQVINGFYEQNKLADPTTIVPCIDTTTAANIVALVPQVLKKASSILTIAQVATLVENFVKTLNPAVGECLKDNKEVAELATVFDVSKITQQAAINWATGHASTVTGEATTLNKLWSSAQYNQLGNNASSFAHTVINQISGNANDINATNQQILQDFYNGLYQQQGLPNPTFTVCYPDAAAADFVNFAPGFLKKGSSILTINAAFTDLQKFTEDQAAKYPQIGECSKNYASELQALSDALGVKNPATVQDTIKNYITANLSSTTKAFGDANNSWKGSNYVQSGKQVSAWVKLALAKNQMTEEEVNATNQQILQDFYNGLYQQQGLPNPTFVTVCYPDAAAADFVNFAPGFLKKGSSILTINAAFTDLQKFTEDQAAKYPQIGECSKNYASELQALSDALGVKNPATVQDTIKNYITANLSSTTKAFGDANNSWKGSNYVQSGKQVSAWVKLALAKNAFSEDQQIMF